LLRYVSCVAPTGRGNLWRSVPRGVFFHGRARSHRRVLAAATLLLSPVVESRGHGRADPTLIVRGNEACWGLQGPIGPASVYAQQREHTLEVKIWGADASWLQTQVRALFGLQDDPSQFVPQHPRVEQLARRFAGMHLVKAPRFDARLCQVVLLQLVSWHDAICAWRALVGHAGEPALGIRQLRCPPRLAVLSKLPVARLVAFGMPYQHAHTLLVVAHDRRLLERIAALAPSAAVEVLQQIRGIGPWTANYVLGTAASYADAVLTGDLHLPNAVAWMLNDEARADDARMLDLLEPFRSHRFRIVRYLWASGAHAPRRGARLDRSTLGHAQARRM